MKRRIDPEQLNELSPKGKEKLREWWKKNLRIGDCGYYYYNTREFLQSRPNLSKRDIVDYFKGNENEIKSQCFITVTDKLFEADSENIFVDGIVYGQQNSENIRMYNINFCLPLLDNGQMIEMLDEKLPYGWYHIERDSERTAFRINHKYEEFDEDGKPELCDSLWQVVKEVVARLV